MPPNVRNCFDTIRDLASDGCAASDGELLEAFRRERCEAALSVLVRRHGAMVWGICRRLLGTGADAEDAFQGTFLVFFKKAAAIREPEKVANWLFGVARQTAVRVRARRAKQAVRERQVEAMPERAVAPTTVNELGPLLDEELGRLPEKYRLVIVLCDLEDRPRSAVAQQLGCPDGTIAARLARGRDMLARRLVRRGVSVPAGGLVVALWAPAASAVPVPLFAAAMSASVTALVQEVVRAMALSKLKYGALLVLVMLGVAGASYLACTAATQPADPIGPAPVVAPGPLAEANVIEGRGLLVPSQSAWVYPVYEGTLVEWHCKSGAVVHKGQKIATVSSLDAEEKLAELRAEIEVNKRIIEGLPKDGPEAALTLVAVRMTLERKTRELEAFHKRYQNGAIVVPCGGTVIIPAPADLLGRAVTPKEPIFRVVRLDGDWYAHVWFAQADVGELLRLLRDGGKGRATVDLIASALPGQTFKGTLDVADVGAQVTERNGKAVLYARVRIDADSLKTLRGLPVDAEVMAKVLANR